MYTLLKPLFIREELLKRGIYTFIPLEFERIFNLSPLKTKYFLEKESQAGLLLRLKKGLYTLKTDMPSEEEIANKLYRPSYISFEYALAYYNILPEMPYTLTSATTKVTRNFIISEKNFSYFTIKKIAYTGYQPIKKADGRVFLIAEPEKALVDYLYFVSLNKKPFNDRLILSSLDKEKILKYADLYKRKGLTKLIKKLL